MYTNRLTIPIKLATLLVGFGLLVVGCDSVGFSDEDTPGDDAAETFKVTNDLGDRLTVFSGSSSNAATNAKSEPTFDVVAQVEPPSIQGSGGTIFSGSGEEVRASHLDFGSFDSGSEQRLYVGYKVLGEGFGGGIDIIDVSTPGSPDGNSSAGSGDANALQVPGLDVQEVAVDASNSTLFVAGADDPDNGLEARPSEFQSINLFDDSGFPSSSVNFSQTELPGRLVKSTTNAAGNSNWNAYAVTDANTFHRFDINTSPNREINSTEVLEEPGAEFRSVTATENGSAFMLSDGGILYEAKEGESSLTNQGQAVAGSELNDLGISRLSSRKINGDNLIFLALNDGGFKVANATTGDPVYENAEVSATSVTATDEFVYVATGDQIAVFEVDDSGTSGLTGSQASSDVSTGLVDLGQAPLSAFSNSASADITDAQVNHILVDGDYLYIAKSTDGVLVVKKGSSNTFP